MPVTQNSARLHKTTYILVWAQAILGGVLLAPCWPPLTHGIFAVLAAVSLLCVHKLNARGARGTVRAIVSLFWVLVLMLSAQTLDAAVGGFTADHLIRLQDGVCWFGAPFLCYLSPAAVAAALFHGEHTAGYDRLMGCVVPPALLGAACMALFTDAEIPWTAGATFLPYAWFALILVAAVAVWMSVRAHTPEQQTAIDRRRQKRLDAHAARIEKRKNGVR